MWFKNITNIEYIDEAELFNFDDTLGIIADDMDVTDLYDDMLDSDGTITVCGYNYNPSYILKQVDPTAYRCGMLDFTDSLLRDIESDLFKMSVDETINFYGVEILCVEE